MRLNRPNPQPVKASKESAEIAQLVYADAIEAVQTAIDKLGVYAKRKDEHSEFAKEQIANLGVILMELKSAE